MPVEGGIVDLDRIEAACDERTRIVTLSWVGYATGWRIDVRQVDAAQTQVRTAQDQLSYTDLLADGPGAVTSVGAGALSYAENVTRQPV